MKISDDSDDAETILKLVWIIEKKTEPKKRTIKILICKIKSNIMNTYLDFMIII